MLEKVKNFAKRQVEKVKTALTVKEAQIKGCAHAVLDGTVAEGYVDTGVKILIAVVIGALLLAGLYALFNTTIMPTVTKKVTDLFNYKGK
ncbi:MAG: hypothetical protein IJS90_06175 [Clostridia bacterium]|nr:hypothetical protein [Clostridia bacterium]